jgi:enoyl reductase-like protein
LVTFFESLYTKETGGIPTVQLELGKPIHKVTTQGVKLWKEFNNTVFKLLKEKRVVWLLERCLDMIVELNCNFLKPWFG